jgi:hypothetical protein
MLKHIQALPTAMPPPTSTAQVLPLIYDINEQHAQEDAQLDAQDLLHTLRSALRSNSDLRLIEVLQVDR